MMVRQFKVSRVLVKPSLWHRWALPALLGLVPLGLAAAMQVKPLLIAALLVAGIAAMIRSGDVRACMKKAGAIIAASFAVLLYAIANVLVHGLGWGPLDLPSHMLLFMAIAALFALPVNLRVTWLCFGLTAALLGLVCIYQHYVLGIDRAYGLNGGEWSAIEFAMFILVLVLVALTRLLDPRTPRPDRWVYAAAIVLGMYGALLTQSRGPLIAFVPLFVLVVVLGVRRHGQKRIGLALVVGAVLGGVLATASLHQEMVTRFKEVPEQIETFTDRNETSGAIPERLEMWRTALAAFREHPWSGVGLDQFGTYARSQIAEGRSSTTISKYTHPHSEYLEAAATGGVPGLGLLLLLFGVPLAYFCRRLWRPSPDEYAPALIGLCVVAMYAMCGLVDNVFYRAMPHSLFFFLVLGMAVRCAFERRREPV
jgi:O-antigen ligase